MANIKFNKKVFEKEIGKLDEDMQHKIAMFGTPVEEITDEEVEIEVFPNRPDLLSYQGFKRSFLAFLGKKTGLKQYKLKKPEKNFKVIIDESVLEIRPYTACAIIKGLKFDDNKIKEIIDIQEKLHFTVGRKRKKVAIGIYPLEKIKLPITFKALEPDKIKFIPLESPREMNGLQILQRHPTGKEYAHLLEGKTKFPIFIDDNENILSMPPIINSQLTGKITKNTKDVFIECSGADFEILKKCLNILITAMADMGGKIYQMELHYPRSKGGKQKTPNLEPEKTKISIDNTNKILGLNLSEKQIKQCLEKMGYNYHKGSVEIPAWRTDFMHEVDLIEDVAIAYGYDNFKPEIPEISTIAEENPHEIIKRKLAEICVGLNMLETSSYHLTTKRDQFEKMGVTNPLKQKEKYIEILDSKTEYNLLRKNLSHCLLKILSENINAEYPQKIFEIGKVFDLDYQENIIETEHFSTAIAPGNFTELKQILEYIGKMLDLEFRLEEPDEFPKYFIDGRVAAIKLGQEEIGFIGEIHPKILRNWKIKMPVVLFEISLEKILDKLIN